MRKLRVINRFYRSSSTEPVKESVEQNITATTTPTTATPTPLSNKLLYFSITLNIIFVFILGALGAYKLYYLFKGGEGERGRGEIETIERGLFLETISSNL